ALLAATVVGLGTIVLAAQDAAITNSFASAELLNPAARQDFAHEIASFEKKLSSFSPDARRTTLLQAALTLYAKPAGLLGAHMILVTPAQRADATAVVDQVLGTAPPAPVPPPMPRPHPQPAPQPTPVPVPPAPANVVVWPVYPVVPVVVEPAYVVYAPVYYV